MDFKTLVRTIKQEEAKVANMGENIAVYITEVMAKAMCEFQWQKMTAMGWDKEEFAESYRPYAEKITGCWACCVAKNRPMEIEDYCENCPVNFGCRGPFGCAWDKHSPYRYWKAATKSTEHALLEKDIFGKDVVEEEVRRNLMKYYASVILRHIRLSWEPSENKLIHVR